MPRGCVNLDQIGNIDRTSRSDSTKTKSTKFIFDSSIGWKPMQSAKMRCNVVYLTLRSFQDEAGCIVLNLFEVCLEGTKEGTAIIPVMKEQKPKQEFWWLEQRGNVVWS